MKNVVNHVPEPDELNARAGIIAPGPIQLKEGSYIYRFASHTPNFGYHASAGRIQQTAVLALILW
jgi:hypothetical protein